MKIFIVVLVLFSQSGFAKDIHCSVKYNGTVVLNSSVLTLLNQKMKFASLPYVTAYLTEKENQQYSIEAFIPEQEQRIYSDGTLRGTKDRLVLSLWSRDLLLDLTCSNTLDLE